jgi:hypothetical protein
MPNRFSAPLPNDPQATYTLVRTFNASYLLMPPDTFAPYQSTTIRVQSPAGLQRPQPVCPGTWRFIPNDTSEEFTNFYNNVIKTASPDPDASIKGLFVLEPNVLWNAAMEARLGIRLPTIYVYAGATMTGQWLMDQRAVLNQFPVLLQPPTLFDYYRGNHIAGENPFAAFEAAGRFGWRADKTSAYAKADDVYRPDSPMPLEHDDRNALYLSDVDRNDAKSGAVRIKVAAGWAVELELTTGNNHYFDILNGVADVEIGDAETNFVPGSNNRVTLTLFEDDELQISIDANEHPTIAPTNFSLHLASRGGVTIQAAEGWIASIASVDDECWIELRSARRIADPTAPVQLPFEPSDPNTVYNAIPVEGHIRLVPAGEELTPEQWKLLALLRGQVAVPAQHALSVPLPPLDETAPGEGELTIACGFQLQYQQEARRYAPGFFAPSPLESIYQRAFDQGIHGDVIEGGNTHPVVQLFTYALTPRNAEIKFAEEEYFPEPDSMWVGGMRFDDCYPSGLVSSEWDGYYMRWQSPYDDGWRRSVISRNGTTYVEVKTGTPTVIGMFKRDVKIRYMIGSPPDDRLPFNPQGWLIGDQDLTGAAASYTCVLEPRTPSTGIAPHLPMFYDPRVIEDWIEKHLGHYNRNVVGRTGWMLGYWNGHPEIAWALFEHVMFRNHGILIQKLHRNETTFNFVTGLLADWAIFVVALFAAGAIGAVAIIVLMVLTIALMVLRGLDYQSEIQGNDTFEGVSDELREQILEILEKSSRASRIGSIIDYTEQILKWAAEYLYVSFGRTIETVNYLTMLNGFPQLMAYRWVKRYGTRDGSDRAEAVFGLLMGQRFRCSSFIAGEWKTFAASARQAGFWPIEPPEDLLRNPAVVKQAAAMWIDQHQVLEATICGAAASGHNEYIGYYYEPAHVVLRALTFFEGFDLVVPQGGTATKHLPFRLTKQTIGELFTAYAQWLNTEVDEIVDDLRAILDPAAASSTGPRLDTLLAKYPARGAGTPPAEPAAELQNDLAVMLGDGGLFDRLVKLMEQAANLAELEGEHPFPPVRDGFGNLERRIEMMLETYSGVMLPNGSAADDSRIAALRAWLAAHATSSGDLAPSGATIEEIIDDEMSDEFKFVTNITHRYVINPAGMPNTDWSAGPSGMAAAAKLKADFASKPLAAWPDPF